MPAPVSRRLFFRLALLWLLVGGLVALWPARFGAGEAAGMPVQAYVLSMFYEYWPRWVYWIAFGPPLVILLALRLLPHPTVPSTPGDHP